MPKPSNRLLASLALAAAIIALAGLAVGPVGYVGGSVVAVLAVIWRHDTPLGTCSPLAVLFLLAFAILLLLLYLTAAMVAT